MSIGQTKEWNQSNCVYWTKSVSFTLASSLNSFSLIHLCSVLSHSFTFSLFLSLSFSLSLSHSFIKWKNVQINLLLLDQKINKSFSIQSALNCGVQSYGQMKKKSEFNKAQNQNENSWIIIQFFFYLKISCDVTIDGQKKKLFFLWRIKLKISF